MNRITKCVAFIAVTIALTVSTHAAAPRTVVVNGVGLELEGKFVGFVKSAEGGNIFGEVVKEPPSGEFFVRKHIESAAPRDLVLEFGVGMDTVLYNWIKTSLQQHSQPRDGALLILDRNTVVSRLEFQQGVITQVTFPALDHTSKDVFKMSIRITPASTSVRKGGETVKEKAVKKQASASLFSLAIDGLEMPLAWKLDALTINLPWLDPRDGCPRCEGKPGPIDFPNVVATVSPVYAAPLQDWLNGLVNGDQFERSGTLDVLSADGRSSVFQLKFDGLGIFEAASQPATEQTVAHIVVSMYCEKLDFNF